MKLSHVNYGIFREIARTTIPHKHPGNSNARRCVVSTFQPRFTEYGQPIRLRTLFFGTIVGASSLGDVGMFVPFSALEAFIRERNCLLTRSHVEALVRETRRGINTGLMTFGPPNFFYTENEKGEVRIGRTWCSRGRWETELQEFREFLKDAEINDCCFLSRNPPRKSIRRQVVTS